MKKFAALLLFLAGAWGALSTYKDSADLYHFCPIDGPCFEHNPAIQGKILFLYLSASQWNSIIPWLSYWTEQNSFGKIFIIQYDGESVALWREDLKKNNLYTTFILDGFDSSPYKLYPMGSSPALYVINEDYSVLGPVYRYDQVP